MMKSFLRRVPGPHVVTAARRTVKTAATARHSGSSSAREGVTTGWSEEGVAPPKNYSRSLQVYFGTKQLG